MKCFLCDDKELPIHALYCFPRNPSRKKLWMKYCNMEVWNSSYRLCANHFSLKSFTVTGLLKKYAIPNVEMSEINVTSRLPKTTMVQQTSSMATQGSSKVKHDVNTNMEIQQPNVCSPSSSIPTTSSGHINLNRRSLLPRRDKTLTKKYQFPKISSDAIKVSLKERDSDPNKNVEHATYNLPSPSKGDGYVNKEGLLLSPEKSEGTSSSSLGIPKASSEAIQGSFIEKRDSDTNKNAEHTIFNLPSPSKGDEYVNEERLLSPPEKSEGTSSSSLDIPKASSETVQTSLILKHDLNTNKNVQHTVYNLPPSKNGGYLNVDRFLLSSMKNEGTSSSVQLPQTGSSKANQDSLKPKGDSDIDKETPVLEKVRSHLSPPSSRSYEGTSSDIQLFQTNSPSNSSKSNDDSDTNPSNTDDLNAEGYNAMDGSDTSVSNTDDLNAEGFDAVEEGSNTSASNTDDLNAEGYDAVEEGSDANVSNTDDLNAEDYDAVEEGSDANVSNTDDLNAEDYNADDGSDTNDLNAEGYNGEGYNAEGYNGEGYNGEGYNVVDSNAVDSNANDSSTDATNTDDSDNDEFQYHEVPYMSLPSIPHATLERSSPPLEEEEYEDTSNNDHISQATSSSMTTSINDANTHAAIPNLNYYPSEPLALGSIKQERFSPPPEEEYEDTLNSFQNPQATTSSNSHAAIPKSENYYSHDISLDYGSIKVERFSPPPEEEYEDDDTLNNLQIADWQQINKGPQSCPLNYYGSLMEEPPAIVLSNVKTERITPTHEPSYESYTDEYGNYENYENMENPAINQPMYLPESHSEFQYEDNNDESNPENETAVGESEMNEMETADPEEIAKLCTTEFGPHPDLLVEPGTSNDVDGSSSNVEENASRNALKRKLSIVSKLELSNKKLRQENADLIKQLEALKNGGGPK